MGIIPVSKDSLELTFKGDPRNFILRAVFCCLTATVFLGGLSLSVGEAYAQSNVLQSLVGKWRQVQPGRLEISIDDARAIRSTGTAFSGVITADGAGSITVINVEVSCTYVVTIEDQISSWTLKREARWSKKARPCTKSARFARVVEPQETSVDEGASRDSEAADAAAKAQAGAERLLRQGRPQSPTPGAQ
jgi:hypothetical protein